MSEQRGPNLWLPPSPDPYAPSADDFRPPPEPQRSPDPEPVGRDPFGGDPKPWWKRAGGGVAALGLLDREVRGQDQGRPAAAAEAEDPDDVGVDARVGRRLQPDLGLEVRASASSLLLFVHEMGHVIQLRREGDRGERAGVHPVPRRASCGRSRSAATRSPRRASGSPARSSARSARRRASPIASATGNDFWRALAFTGFFLNLFNLLPVVPLDGGRAMAAMAPWMWFARARSRSSCSRSPTRTRSSC